MGWKSSLRCDPAVPHEHAGSCRWPRCSRRSGRAAAPAQAPSNGILSFSILLSYCFFYVGFYITFLFSLSLNDAGRRIRTGRAWRDQCVAASIRGASKYIFTCSSIWLPATRRCSFAFVQPAWPPRMQRGIAKLILNGYTDRLFLLFLLLFVPSSDISLGTTYGIHGLVSALDQR